MKLLTLAVCAVAVVAGCNDGIPADFTNPHAPLESVTSVLDSFIARQTPSGECHSVHVFRTREGLRYAVAPISDALCNPPAPAPTGPRPHASNASAVVCEDPGK